MATEILRPNAAGDETNVGVQYPAAGYHWDKVDEETSDGDSTRVEDSNKTTFHRDLYNLPAHTGSGTINKVTVYALMGRWTSGSIDQDHAKICAKTHSSVYEEIKNVDALYWFKTFSYEMTANPDTGSAWTWDEIDALQIGISLRSFNSGGYNTVKCTQVYVEVDYTPGETPKTSSDSGSGVDAVDSLQTPAAKLSSDAGSGVEGTPLPTAMLAGSESGYGVEASSVETDGLFRELFAAELGEGSDTLTAKIEMPTKGGGMKLWT